MILANREALERAMGGFKRLKVDPSMRSRIVDDEGQAVCVVSMLGKPGIADGAMAALMVAAYNSIPSTIEVLELLSETYDIGEIQAELEATLYDLHNVEINAKDKKSEEKEEKNA